MTKFKIVSTVVIAVILGVSIYGAYQYPKLPVSFGTSTQGGTGSTARQFNVYGVNLAAPGNNATSSSVLNNTGNDLYVTGVKIGCEGVGTSKTAYTGTGLAALTVTVGTTTFAATSSASLTPIATAITMATGSVDFLSASSTQILAGNAQYLDIWNAGTYMNFFTNATNTAVCTFGVDTTSS
jgi:hypothetical protein